jgi:hypothetical protein
MEGDEMSILLLAVLAASPSIEVNVSPKGRATVHIEAEWGVVAGETGVTIPVKPGPAVVRVTRPGYWDAWGSIVVRQSGHKRIRLVQKPGIPLDEFPLSGSVFFPKGGWKRSETTPWKVSGKRIIVSGKAPGMSAGVNLVVPLKDNYVLSCRVVASNVKRLKVFGQSVAKTNAWTDLKVVSIKGKEYVWNGTGFKKADTIQTRIDAYYASGASIDVIVSSIQWKSLSDANVKYLRRVYGL